MRELGKDDETDRQERRAAGHRRIDHLQHAVGVPPHLRAIDRVREVGLTGGGGVPDGVAHGVDSSSGGTERVTTRVFQCC